MSTSSLVLDPFYISSSLIPLLTGSIFPATELGGNIASISTFSYAGGSSTYSFGLFQYDVGSNAAARNFLSEIGFSPAQISMLSQQGNLMTAAQVTALSAQLSTALQIPGNQILLQQLNASWANGLVGQLQSALTVIAQNNPSIADQIYESPDLQARLIDYANQFGLSPTGPMVLWLSGQSVGENGTRFQLTQGQQLTDGDITAFVLHTDEGVSINPTGEVTRENALNTAISTATLGTATVDVGGSFSGTFNNMDVFVQVGAQVLIGGSGDSFFMANGSSINLVSGVNDTFSCGATSVTVTSGSASLTCSSTGILNINGGSTTGISQSISLDSTDGSGTIVVDGQSVLAFGAGASVNLDAGSITVTSAPALGWTTTTQLSQNGDLTQTFGSTDSLGGAITLNYGDSSNTSGAGSVQLTGATLDGLVIGATGTGSLLGALYTDVQSSAQTDATNAATQAGSMLSVQQSAIGSALASGQVSSLPSDPEGLLTALFPLLSAAGTDIDLSGSILSIDESTGDDTAIVPPTPPLVYTPPDLNYDPSLPTVPGVWGGGSVIVDNGDDSETIDDGSLASITVDGQTWGADTLPGSANGGAGLGSDYSDFLQALFGNDTTAADNYFDALSFAGVFSGAGTAAAPLVYIPSSDYSPSDGTISSPSIPGIDPGDSGGGGSGFGSGSSDGGIFLASGDDPDTIIIIVDPLVLSLNGLPINLLSQQQAQTEYGADLAGQSMSTGWVGADTGILVSVGADGVVSPVSNFAALAALDVNHDGVIDASDPGFANLEVWVDANGDGIVEPGELVSLSSLDIQSLSVSSTATNQVVNGNTISSVGSLTFANGSTEAVDDVNFEGSVPEASTPALTGESAVALAFYSRVLEYLPAEAEGTAQQIAQSVSTVALWAEEVGSGSTDTLSKGTLYDVNDVAVVGGDTLVYNEASPTYGNILELDYNHIYILTADGHVESGDAPEVVGMADNSVAQVLTSIEGAAQAVQAATKAQSNSEDAAMTADMSNADIGSTSDQGAAGAAAATEQAWLAAFTSIAAALNALPTTTTALTAAAAAVAQIELPAGARYLTADDAQQAVGTLLEQGDLTEGLADGTAAFETLLAAVAQAWNVSQITFAAAGSTMQATGGDLVLAAAGAETLSDGATPSTYVLLPGAELEIIDFHTGASGSRLDFLSPGATLTLTEVNGGTQIQLGSTSVFLVGVAASALSYFDNFAGVSAASFANLNDTKIDLSSDDSMIDDGTTHIDTLTVIGTNDILIANYGIDVLSATGSSNTLIGGAGADMLTVSGSGNTLVAGVGTSELMVSGTGASNVLVGGAGTDELTVTGTSGQQESNTLIGGTGNDVMRVTGNSDTLIAGGGIDVLYAIGGADTLVGGSGDDLLSVTGSGNILIGGSGTSELVSDVSGNTLVGGTGLTQAFYTANGMTVNLADGAASINGSGVSDTLVGVASADVVGNNDTLIGGNLSGTLWGSGQGDTLIGGSGTTTLVSNLGGNTLLAGTGSTQAWYTYDDIVIDLATGAVTNVHGGGTSDTLLGISQAFDTGNSDTLIGAGGGGDMLAVVGTGDTLVASGTDNTLAGGNASVLMANEVGGNTLIAGTGAATVAYDASGVTIDLETDTVSENGTDVADTLLGMFAIAQVTGSQDTLIGEATASTLVSNAAGNTLIAGTGPTQAWYGVNGVTVNLGAGTAEVNGANLGDTLTGIVAAVVAGNNDTLVSSVIGEDILIAAGNDDTLVALGTGNTLEGGRDATTLLSDAQGNTLIAGIGPTVVFYGSGVAVDLDTGMAVLNATGAHDSLVGITATQVTGSDDTLIGGNTASTLISDALGNTLIAGVAPTDVDYTGDNLTINLNTGKAGVNGVNVSDTLVGISIARVAGDDNTIVGGNGDVLIDMSGNSDTLVATGTAETLQGGSGNSTLLSSTAANTLLGGTGSTTADYSANDLVIDLATGIVTGGGANGVIQDIDDIQVTGNNDTIIGSTAGDALVVLGNNNTIVGSSHDLLEAKGNYDTLIASLGGDDFLQAVSGIGNTLVTSGSGNTLEGGTGDTTLVSDAAGNTLIGGIGRTVASYSGAGITVDLETGTAIGNGSSTGGDTLIGITAAEVSGFDDTLIGSNTGGDDLQASGTGDTLTANGGGDVLKAGSGSSTLGSNAAGNTLIGTAGATVAYYGGDNVVVNLADGRAEVNGAGASDTLVNIEAAQAGGTGDTLYGGAEITTLASNGAGNTLIAGTNRTVVSYDGSGLSVNLASGTAAVNGGSASDTLLGIMAGSVGGNADTLIGGSSGGDFLAATGNNDTLISSGSGNTLEGASGSDTLITNAAGNTLVGGAGATAAFYTGNGLTVNLANGLVTAAGATAGALAGVSDVIAAGTSDVLIAGSGNDTLDSEGSHDVLEGGTGISTLTGNGNSDTLTVGSGLTVAEYGGLGTTINLAMQRATMLNGTSGDSLVGITVAEAVGSGETLIGINDAMSTLIGTAEGDTLVGGAIYDATYVNSQTDVQTYATLQTVAYYAGNNISATDSSVSVSGSGVADILSGISDVEIVGNNDTFAGVGGTITGDHDTISGSGTVAGNDGTLIGGGSIVGDDNTLIGNGDITGNSNIASGGYLIAISGTNNILIGTGTGGDFLEGFSQGTTTLVSTALQNSLEGGFGPAIAQYASGIYVDLGQQMAEQWSTYWHATTYNTGAYAPGDPGYQGDTLYDISIAQAGGSGDILIAADNDTVGSNGEGNTLISEFYDGGGTQFPQLNHDALNSEAYFYANNLSINSGFDGLGYASSAQGQDTLIGYFTEYAVSGNSDYMLADSGLDEASGSNDTITGGNTMEATGNNDVLIGGETLLATGYSDTLIAGGLMEAGVGTSILIGWADGATLIGGSAGASVASYGNALIYYDSFASITESETLISTGLVIDLGNGTASGGTLDYSAIDRYDGVATTLENSVSANSGVDTLIGISIAQATSTGETLIGGAGVTTLASNLQGNTLIAGTGRTIAYYSQNDGNIQLGGVGQNGEASVGFDGPGSVSDVLVGIRAAEVTGTGDDVTGSAAGGNLLETSGTEDSLSSAGTGNTLLVLGGDDNVLTGSSGDVMEILGGTDSELIAARGDTLIATAGSSVLVGDLDNNTLIAISGQTQVDYAAGEIGTVVNLATGIAADQAGGFDTLIGIRSAEVSGTNATLIGSNFGGDYLQVAGQGSMAIAAGSGNTLSGAKYATLISSSVGGNTLTSTNGALRTANPVAYYSENFMTIDLATGIASGYGRENDTLVGVGEVETSGQDETLIGGSVAATLAAAMVNGNTLIAGTGATEALYTGNDVSIDLADSLVESGDSVDDTLVGVFATVGASGSHDVLTGGAGPADFVGTGANDTLIGGTGKTTLISNLAGNTLIAGTGPTILDYSTAKAVIDLATDVVDARGASDTLIGVFSDVVASGLNSTLIGAITGGDLLEVTGVDDTIIASGGDNILDDAYGNATLVSETVDNNTLTGSSGTVADYSEVDVVVDLATGRATAGANPMDTLIGILSAEASGAHDTLIGSSGASVLVGSINDDTLIAGSRQTEAEYIEAGIVVNLGTGVATNGSASDSLVGITVAFVGGTNDTLISSSSGGDTLFGAQNISDTLIGNLEGNTLYGGLAYYSNSNLHLSFNGVIGSVTATINGVTRSDELESVTEVELTGNDDTLSGGNSSGGLTLEPTVFADGVGDTLIGNADGGSFESDAAGNTLIGTSSDVVNAIYDGNGITVNLATGTAKALGAAFGDTLIGVAGAEANGDHDVLIGGNGTYALLQSGGTENTLVAGIGGTDEISDSGNGYDYFDVGLGDGSVSIYNGDATNAAVPINELDFGVGISESNLWFVQSGVNLLIDVLGTGTSVYVPDSLSGGFTPLEKITAGGLTIDSQVSQLIQAMATYSGNNPGFNPVTATQMPTDPTLQNAIAAAWHA